MKLSEWLKIYFGPSDYRALRAFRRVGIVPTLVGWPTRTRNHIAAVNNVRSCFFVKTANSRKYVEQLETLPLDWDALEEVHCRCSHCTQTCDCFRRRDAPACHSHCRGSCQECEFEKNASHDADCDCEDCDCHGEMNYDRQHGLRPSVHRAERASLVLKDDRRRLPVRRCTTVAENSESHFGVDPRAQSQSNLRLLAASRSPNDSDSPFHLDSLDEDAQCHFDSRGTRRISIVSFTPNIMPLVAKDSASNVQDNAVYLPKAHDCKREHSNGRNLPCVCSNKLQHDDAYLVECQQSEAQKQQTQQRSYNNFDLEVDERSSAARLKQDESTFANGGLDNRRRSIRRFMSIDVLDSNGRSKSPQQSSEEESRGHSDSRTVKNARARCHSMLVLASPSDDGNSSTITVEKPNHSTTWRSASRTEVHRDSLILRERNELLEARVRQLENGMRRLSVKLTGPLDADDPSECSAFQNQTNSHSGEYARRSANDDDDETSTQLRESRIVYSSMSCNNAEPLVGYDASLESHYHSNGDPDHSPLSNHKSIVHEQVSTVVNCQLSPAFDQLTVSDDPASEAGNASADTTILLLDRSHLKSRYQ